MAEESKSNPAQFLTSNVLERAKGKIESALHSYQDDKETHGKRNGIDENTPLGDVKAPNVFERAKEEIEALVETIHQNIESQANEKRKRSVMVTKLIEKAKEKIEAITQHHNKETHGRRDDIDETTTINEVKGPNVFERAKEEFEAVIETIHPKKEPIDSPEEGKGLWCSIGKWFEKVCNPLGSKSKGD